MLCHIYHHRDTCGSSLAASASFRPLCPTSQQHFIYFIHMLNLPSATNVFHHLVDFFPFLFTKCHFSVQMFPTLLSMSIQLCFVILSAQSVFISACKSFFLLPFFNNVSLVCTFWSSTLRRSMMCCGSGTDLLMAVFFSKSWVVPVYHQIYTAPLTPSPCSSPLTSSPANKVLLCNFQVGSKYISMWNKSIHNLKYYTMHTNSAQTNKTTDDWRIKLWILDRILRANYSACSLVRFLCD